MRALNQRPRVAIVGAGPQGLTAAVYLAVAGVQPEDMIVVDPSGSWLEHWHRWFAHLGIAHLRSPGVHHPHPKPYSLMQFAQENRRSAELVEKYGLPSTALFGDFCRHLVERHGLGDMVWADRVAGVTPEGRLTLGAGLEIDAEHVVWATNPSVRPPWPRALGREVSGVVAWDEVELDAAVDTVAVVGGGLTAAHLVDRAVGRCSRVTWVTRRRVQVREFDTDPGWLGPRRMSEFDKLDEPAERMRVVIEARSGGSVPSWMMRRLRRAEDRGVLVRRGGEVGFAEDRRAGRVLCVDSQPVHVEQVWMATGDRPSLEACPALNSLCSTVGISECLSRPVLDHNLRLKGSVVQVMGRLAQIRLGPTAGNLAGARRGAEHVVAAVVGLEAMYDLLGV